MYQYVFIVYLPVSVVCIDSHAHNLSKIAKYECASAYVYVWYPLAEGPGLKPWASHVCICMYMYVLCMYSSVFNMYMYVSVCICSASMT